METLVKDISLRAKIAVPDAIKADILRRCKSCVCGESGYQA